MTRGRNARSRPPAHEAATEGNVDASSSGVVEVVAKNDELGMNGEELATFKKKLDFGKKDGKKRKGVFEEDIGDDFESDSDQEGSPTYAESGDSSSHDSEGNGEDDGGVIGQPSHGEESNGDQAGAADVLPTPLRPRSKRLKKVSVKGLYGK